jgi:hypothetical protein
VELFFRDNHFSDVPTYAAAPSQVSRTLLAALTDHYPEHFSPQDAVQAIGGVNINSKNYRVGDYYVKTVEDPGNFALVRDFPKINRALLAVGVNTPEFVANRDGAWITDASFPASGSRLIYVQKFVDAGFFTGERREFDQALWLLQKLESVAFGGEPLPEQKLPYSTWDPLALFADVRRVLSAKQERDLDAFDQRVIELLPAIHGHVNECVSLRSSLECDGLRHFDLHPHNLLFKEGSFRAVLDLESFRHLPSALATGFNLFKLGRKSICKRELGPAEFKRIAGSEFDLARLYPYAKMEILRRLLGVLDFHYLQHTTKWDVDLEKQASGLEEARVMFL